MLQIRGRIIEAAQPQMPRILVPLVRILSGLIEQYS
jgi:hypothetical protein